MKNANFVVFDCETGGFTADKNPITQIALIALDGKTFEELDRFEMYIKPYDDLVISKQALEVTGLKMADINNGVDKKVAVKNIIAFAKKNSINNSPQNRSILVGHNIVFDLGFIEYLFQSCKQDVYGYFSKMPECTMKLSKIFNKNAKSLKLGDCCAEVGITIVNAHTAMADTDATAKLFRYYALKLQGVEPKAGKVITTEVKEKSRVKFQF